MRNTGTFHDELGKQKFGAWLNTLRLEKGWNKREFLGKLGRESAEAASAKDANRYFSGKVAPTVETVRKLAAAFDINERLMLFRAGLLAPLLGDLPRLVQAARDECESYNERFAARMSGACPAPKARVFMQVSLQDSVFFVPLPILSAAFIVIAAFPLRGERRKRGIADPEELLSSVATDFSAPKLRATAPYELERAAEILSDRLVPPEHRLAAAAEFVRAWFREQCGDFARACESKYYSAGTLLSPFHQSRAILAKATGKGNQQ